MKLVNLIECEVYSRVVGYYRPVKNWNIGKQAEFESRVMLTMPNKGMLKGGKNE